jgi:hypothetical protein
VDLEPFPAGVARRARVGHHLADHERRPGLLRGDSGPGGESDRDDGEHAENRHGHRTRVRQRAWVRT